MQIFAMRFLSVFNTFMPYNKQLFHYCRSPLVDNVRTTWVCIRWCAALLLFVKDKLPWVFWFHLSGYPQSYRKVLVPVRWKIQVTPVDCQLLLGDDIDELPTAILLTQVKTPVDSGKHEQSSIFSHFPLKIRRLLSIAMGTLFSLSV